MKLILPPGWTLSAPARVSWIRTETRNGVPRSVISHPMRRTLTSPDGCERSTAAALNADTLEYINTILQNYGEKPATVPA